MADPVMLVDYRAAEQRFNVVTSTLAIVGTVATVAMGVLFGPVAACITAVISLVVIAVHRSRLKRCYYPLDAPPPGFVEGMQPSWRWIWFGVSPQPVYLVDRWTRPGPIPMHLRCPVDVFHRDNVRRHAGGGASRRAPLPPSRPSGSSSAH